MKFESSFFERFRFFSLLPTGKFSKDFSLSEEVRIGAAIELFVANNSTFLHEANYVTVETVNGYLVAPGGGLRTSVM